MGFSNAEVLVKFVGNTDGLDKKTKEASQTIKGFGKSVGGILGSIGTLALATSALVVTEALKGIKKIVQASVEAYSNFEQLEGGLVSLFGEGSAEMNRILEDSQKAYKNLTMSQNDYLTSFQSAYPLVNAGLNSNKDAIEYTNKVLQLSSDLFNTYGGSIDYYQNAINWALKGSFVYLDNLNIGIKGTQEGFIEAANNAGILGRNISNINELTSDEIIDVIQHYAEEYGVWGKTAEEASSTIIGSMNMVKATWDNFILGLSQKNADIDGLVDNLISSVETFLNNVMPVIIRAIESIAKILPSIVEKIAEELPGLLESLLPPLIEAAKRLIQSLAKNLPDIIRILGEAVIEITKEATDLLPDLIDAIMGSAIALIDVLAEAIPTLLPQLVEVIVDGVIKITKYTPQIIQAAITLLMGIIEALPTIITALVDALPEIITTIVDVLIESTPILLDGAIDLFMALVEAIPEIIVALVDALPKIIEAIVNGLIEGIPKILEAFWKIIERLFTAMDDVGVKMNDAIMEFIQKIPYYIGYVIGWIVGAITKFITEDIPNFVNGIIEWIKQLPERITEIINNIINWVKELPGKIISYVLQIKDAIINTIRELPGRMLDIGKNIVNGIWNGILNAKDWVISKVKQFAKGILDGMKSALGIHSPSTEFAILGKFSVLGYTEALDKMKGQVQDTIDSVFNLQPEVSGAMSSTYSPQTNVIVNNNMEFDPLGQLVSNIKTFSGGAKNDYNWGAGV